MFCMWAIRLERGCTQSVSTASSEAVRAVIARAALSWKPAFRQQRGSANWKVKQYRLTRKSAKRTRPDCRLTVPTSWPYCNSAVPIESAAPQVRQVMLWNSYGTVMEPLWNSYGTVMEHGLCLFLAGGCAVRVAERDGHGNETFSTFSWWSEVPNGTAMATRPFHFLVRGGGRTGRPCDLQIR